MAKFLTNPRSLTKDRLKSELEANGVALPKGDQRKQVYIDLYLEHLTSQNEQLDNDGADDRMFSSDEEDDSKSSPKKPPPSRTKHLIRKPVKGLPYDVNALSDGDLARQLRNYGQVVGPITDTTRPLYQKKLINILQEEVKNPDTFQEQLKPPLQQTAPKAWEFSDNEEEEEQLQPSKPVSASRNKRKKDEEVVMIEDKVDAKPVPQEVPLPKECTPKVTRTETIVSESYVETRKRVVANNKSVDSELKSQKFTLPVKPSSDSKQIEGNSWEWKAVLVFLALTTTVLLVYYFMEGSPSSPQLSKKA